MMNGLIPGYRRWRAAGDNEADRRRDALHGERERETGTPEIDPETVALDAMGMTREAWNARSAADRREAAAMILEARGAAHDEAAEWVTNYPPDELLRVLGIRLVHPGSPSTGTPPEPPTDAETVALEALAITRERWVSLSPVDRREGAVTILTRRGVPRAEASEWVMGLGEHELLGALGVRLAALPAPTPTPTHEEPEKPEEHHNTVPDTTAQDEARKQTQIERDARELTTPRRRKRGGIVLLGLGALFLTLAPPGR